MTLTKSEQEIYDLLVNEGMRTRDIAHYLGYSSRTLDNKISSILHKKQVTSQKELIVKHYTDIIKELRLCPSITGI
jgi:DNA-binding NarL/FixJ family response regulator